MGECGQYVIVAACWIVAVIVIYKEINSDDDN
jgi:hypothetical protein